MSLLGTVKTALENVGFTDETINDIEKWPSLVDALNSFVELYPDTNGISIRRADPTGGVSYYSFSDKSIYILPKFFSPITEDGCITNIDQHLAVLDLAHELAHAYQDTTYASSEINYAKQSLPDISTTSLGEYITARNKMEGEAIYNEFMAMHLLYGDKIDADEAEYTKYLDGVVNKF